MMIWCFMILAWKLLLFVFRIKQFDRIIGDWKRKADGLSQELDASQKECRNVSSELFRVRSGYEEASVQLADVKRENATLGDEIKDIMEQISEGNSYRFWTWPQKFNLTSYQNWKLRLIPSKFKLTSQSPLTSKVNVGFT